jgi:hypothetical protein
MRSVVLALGLLVLSAFVSAPVDAQAVTCRKGCPCGNNCISCSKVCHRGEGSGVRARRAKASTPAVVPDSVTAETPTPEFRIEPGELLIGGPIREQKGPCSRRSTPTRRRSKPATSRPCDEIQRSKGRCFSASSSMRTEAASRAASYMTWHMKRPPS